MTPKSAVSKTFNAAVRGIIYAGGADGVFDSHVAKAYRARVHADDEDQPEEV
ncbi:hypothetical protein VE00_09164 [Pseudogymnoascus sp. WSF 3629]|nr:hypothetical protein VE00_09164 [Pseudogymnoascus sp. WSF 3629]